jgi:hypothetical protein
VRQGPEVLAWFWHHVQDKRIGAKEDTRAIVLQDEIKCGVKLTALRSREDRKNTLGGKLLPLRYMFSILINKFLSVLNRKVATIHTLGRG